MAVFRIFFGLMMLLSLVRFWANGWIEKLYLQPEFHFSYYGFEWVQPIGEWTYLLFILCGLSAAMVALGWKYRSAILVFFLSFTYIELMDKTTYLNHYYFISVLSFIMCFLPAAATCSLDARHHPNRNYQFVPVWTVDILKILLALVYFYAGLAKLNSDWMLEALPLKIWLPSKFNIPLLGSLLAEEWVAYAFSWAGAVYDLSIPFLLWWRPTRWFAFVLVVVFHSLTAVLFPIGMFPYIMIVSALIFFSPGIHRRILSGFCRLFGTQLARFDTGRSWGSGFLQKSILPGFLAVFLLFQVLMPWRYLAYPGELFWREEGYRFSWRVMLMEKSGYAQFRVVSGTEGTQFVVDNSEFLTPFQEKQMSFQPDFILQFARFLKEHYEEQGMREVAVYADCYVALNGRPSQRFIDPEVDLGSQRESFQPKKWILPLNDEIKGL